MILINIFQFEQKTALKYTKYMYNKIFITLCVVIIIVCSLLLFLLSNKMIIANGNGHDNISSYLSLFLLFLMLMAISVFVLNINYKLLHFRRTSFDLYWKLYNCCH